MPDPIILLQPLHDDHDSTGAHVLQARVEGVVNGFIDTPALLL
jgi:hypothetical protein